MKWNTFVLVLSCVTTAYSLPHSTSRSFTVDYEHDTFLKDGKPFRYMSGSIHYFRVHPDQWHDRIYKMKMAGLNAIQTYVEWSGHEPESGVYSFEGQYDLPKFLQIAHDLEMVVILRAGPFIDAEREMGGFPYWLMREDPKMNFRTTDPKYLFYVDRFYNVLLPKIEPYLYNNGGPVITMQVENEYGFPGCDGEYKSHLRDLFNRLLKKNVVLFTTDAAGANLLQCGSIDGTLTTIDFGSGSNVTYKFDLLRWTRQSGPLVNSEYYPGWLDHWGTPHANVSIEAVVKTLTDMLAANASVNVYMFHGGTSFGFSAGSNQGDRFQACPTSYDYDAPLSEAGDPTPKYYAMRDAIGKFLPLPPGPVPQPAPKMKSDPIAMKKVVSLWEYIASFNKSVTSKDPLSFESLSHPYGLVLYKADVTFIPTDPVLLTVKGIADRGHVYVNKVLQGVLSREQKIESIPIRVQKGQTVEILVENQGRICTGGGDRKGIFQGVTLGKQTLTNWTMIPVQLDSVSVSKIQEMKKRAGEGDSVSAPAFYSGDYTVKTPLDTFLEFEGWHKGVAYVNNFNLGRYWPIVGPQVTLYAPGPIFKKAPEVNYVTILELENAPCGNAGKCTVQFVENHILNGTTPLL